MPTNVVSLIRQVPNTGLMKYDAACRAIAAAKSTDEAKEIRNKAVALAAYAQQAKNKDLEADAIEIRLRATQKLGQLIQDQKKTVGLNRGNAGGFSTNPPDTRPTLASQGIDKNLANAARKLATQSEEKFAKVIAGARANILTRPGRWFGTQPNPQNEFYTPEKYIKLVKQVFGGVIDLDPASCPAANRIVKAKRILTVTDNSLLQNWSANSLYGNFPYAHGAHGKFMAKLVREYKSGCVREAIVLTRTGIDSRWFQTAIKSCVSACLIAGKIKFSDSKGQQMSQGLPGGSIFFYFGENVELFERVFSQIGSCVRLSRGYAG